MQRGQHVIDQHHHGLAFDHRLTRLAVFVFGDVVGSEIFFRVQVFGALLQPFVEIE